MALPSVRRSRSLLACAALALFSFACGGDGGSEPNTPASVAATVATTQSDTVGKPVAIVPAVVVKTASGKPVAGVPVNFTATSGTGATLGTASATTNAEGIASVGSWTLGTALGSYQVTATVPAIAAPGNTVQFTATAVHDAPAKLAFVQPPLAGSAASLLPNVLVQLQDQYGNPISDVPALITLAIGTNPSTATLGGTLTQNTAAGNVSFTDISISKPGTGYTLVASTTLAGVSPATTAAINIGAAQPSAVAATTATTQSGTVGQPVAAPPTVKVTTNTGAPAPGITVVFAVTQGGGTLGATTVTTDDQGIASAGSWTLGATAGTNTVTATVSGLTTNNVVTFTATGVAGPATKLAIITQPATRFLNSPMADVQVQLQDQYGNPVTTSGVNVTIAIGNNPTGATLGGTLTQPTVNGVATFNNLTLSAVGTGFTLVASGSGLTSVTSSAFNIVSTARISGTVSLASNFTLLNAGTGSTPSATARAARAARLGGAAPRLAVDMTGARRAASPRKASLGARSAASRARYVANELIVTFRESSLGGQVSAAAARRSTSAAQSAARAMRARLDGIQGGGFATRGVSPAVRAARVVVAPQDLDAVAERLRQDPAVESVERNALAHVERGTRVRTRPAEPTAYFAPTPTVASNDTYRNLQSWNYGMIDLPQAWTLTTGSASVIVAVIDNGIRFDHPDIAANLTSDGYDFVSFPQTAPLCGSSPATNADLTGDGNGYDPDPTLTIAYVDSSDAQGNLVCVKRDDGAGIHGLHVAGTIGAVGNNSSGVTGVNWGVKIRPIRALNALGSGSFYDIAQAVLYAAGLPADNGAGGTVTAAGGRAPIINMSLGGPSNVPVLRDAINSAVAAGSLVIVSAGNEGSSDPSYPAAYDNVLSVSAVGPDRLLASYSNFGPAVDIAAPGGDICDEGAETASTPCANIHNGTFGIWSTDWDFTGSGSPIFSVNHGTSMASPHVAGVAALLPAREPGLTASQLRSRLLDYAVDVGPEGRDDSFGAGILNARNSLTQSLSPTRGLFAVLFDASTGARLQTKRLSAGGQYEFTISNPGSYRVYAGQDENNDLQAEPGRRWSAYAPGSRTGKPATIVTLGADQEASFSVGLPSEQEANNTTSTADVLPVGGYLQSTEAASDVDWFRVEITSSGSYTFETVGVDGACGFALEEDTDLTLFQSDGTTQIQRNDDVNTTGLQWCSRITVTLTPGVYFLRAQASSSTTKAVGSISSFAQQRTGRYRVQARSGP